jgi:quercetin dioxygenase-like cupin family protein
MRTLGLVVLLSAAAVLVYTQQPAEVEITSEPSHHQVIQNEFVRVFDVTVAPKSSTLVHRHRHDYLFVTLGDSDVINARAGANPVPLHLKDGEIRFTPGNFAHAAINSSDKPFHNLTIELLKSSTNVKTCTDACSVTVPCAAEAGRICPTMERRISSDQWIATYVTMPAGSRLDKHTHASPHLVAAITDLDLTQQVGDETRHTKVPAGGYAWVPAGLTHTLTNSGTKTAQYVALEFTEQK